MVDLESALKKLDRLTQEEARMALAGVLRVTHSVRDEARVVGAGSQIDDSSDGKRDRRSPVFVNMTALLYLLVLMHTPREPSKTVTPRMAFSRRSV